MSSRPRRLRIGEDPSAELCRLYQILALVCQGLGALAKDFPEIKQVPEMKMALEEMALFNEHPSSFRMSSAAETDRAYQLMCPDEYGRSCYRPGCKSCDPREIPSTTTIGKDRSK